MSRLMYEIHQTSDKLLSCERSDWYRLKNRASGSCVLVSFVSLNVVVIMDGCAPRLSGRTIARRRGRLQRSERVSEPPAPHFAWDIIIRDSLLQIAWPMSLSADTDHQSADNGNVKLRWVHFCTLLQLSMCRWRDEVDGDELGDTIQRGASWLVLITNCYSRDNQEELYGRAMWHITVHTRFWLGTPNGKRQLRDLDVNVRIILEWILKKSVGKTWTRLMWQMIATVGELLW